MKRDLKNNNKITAVMQRFYFFIRNNRYIYLNIVNLKAKRKLNSLQIVLNTTQTKVLEDLRSNGISIVDFIDLCDWDIFNAMNKFIEDNEKNLETKSKKKFLQSYFGSDNSELVLDFSNPFVKFYLSKEVLEIVSTYLGYVPQIYEIYVEKTLPVGEAEKVFSQNWHRDPEEKRTLKVFLYLSDVTEQAGPFTYLQGSAPTGLGKYKNIFRQQLPRGSYPNESDLLKKVNDKDCLVATGKKGTIIFCDTAGLHRGGYAKTEPRIMATAFFPSKAYTLPSRLLYSKTEKLPANLFSNIASKVLDLKN